MPWNIEHTDTFSGVANYGWVNRHTVECPHDDRAKARRWLVRRAKALCGLTGQRATATDHGDMIEIRPAGLCQVVFITWTD
jgi:hypothetical protein